MFTTKALRQAAQHAERIPSIRFLGKRTIPGMFDIAEMCCISDLTRRKDRG